MDIIIDFDGTCVTHSFPYMVKDIGAVPVLKSLTENGHRLILFTMRSDIDKTSGFEKANHGQFLSDAVKWFEMNDIPLYGIQTNPTQSKWTLSPKAYGQLIIDDAALGCPLMMNEEISNRPFVDWNKVKMLLIKMGVIYK